MKIPLQGALTWQAGGKFDVKGTFMILVLSLLCKVIILLSLRDYAIY